MAAETAERKLAAIMIADVVGSSLLMERDESLTFARLRQLREAVTQPSVDEHGGRLIKTTGDGFLAAFPSATAALKCGIGIQRSVIALQSGRSVETRIRFRIGINVGDIIIDGNDVAGDGVNIAARLEALAPPDGICISAYVREQIHDDLGVSLEDLGEQKFKNIERPIRAFAVTLAHKSGAAPAERGKPLLPLPDKPSIAVLPFDNMSGEPEQEYFADGVVEAITATLSRIRSFFVIARNSAFVYKGKSVDVQQVGRELGVRYVLEGSVQKSGNRLRITVQLIDATSDAHVWADRVDGTIEDIFDLQDKITERVAGALQPSIRLAEIERARR